MTSMNAPRADYSARPLTRTTEVVENETVVLSRRSVSWGAILAGVVVTITIMAALNMLGMAIGATTINPLTERDPIEPAFGTAALLWFLGTGLLALFAGGWAASYLANTYEHGSGLLHGLVVWGVSTILAFVMVTSSVSNIVNGLTGALGQGISLLTQGAVETIPEVADSINLQSLTRDAITQESRSLMRNRAATSGTTSDADASTNGTQATAGNQGMANAESNPMTLEDLEFNTRVFGYLNGDQQDQAARDELITFISERTGISQQEASAQLDRWAQSFNSVREDAEQTAREIGEQLTNTLATVGGGLFLAMLLGSVAGSIGGIVGTRDLPTLRTTTTTVDRD